MNIIKKFIYNIKKNHFKKKLTNKLGIVIEYDNKIICYVRKNNLMVKNNSIEINCYGLDKSKINLLNKYDLNKPICYMFDGIDINQVLLRINGYDNCEVVFLKCNFENIYALNINIKGKCKIEDSYIKSSYFQKIYADELMIKNIDKDKIKITENNSNIILNSKKIDIIDSNLGNIKNNMLLTATDNLNVKNSKIFGKKIDIDAKNIDIDGLLTANDRVNIVSKNISPININSPVIIFNNKNFFNKKRNIVLNQYTDDLSLKRLELVNLLKKLRNQCETINARKKIEYQKELNHQTVNKTLKK